MPSKELTIEIRKPERLRQLAEQARKMAKASATEESRQALLKAASAFEVAASQHSAAPGWLIRDADGEDDQLG